MPAQAPEVSTLTMIRKGILLLLYRFGWRAFARLLEVKAYHERVQGLVASAQTVHPKP
jgi:hypothetical protein